MNKLDKIYIAGNRGMVGSAIERLLAERGYTNIVGVTSAELDLTRQSEVEQFFEAERPEYVFLAAAKVGGIHANNEYPADFIYKNLLIESNIIHSSYRVGCKRLLFLGSSCIYPKFAPQPMSEASLLTGKLEQTNEPYAVAKIAGIKLCESYYRQYRCDFRSVMPTNLYGPGDNFSLKNSHVIPALIRKFHEAKANDLGEVEIWGTGTPEREFLHVDDMARACLYVMGLSEKEYWGAIDPMCSHINVGFGDDVSIAQLVDIVSNAVGFKGNIRFNTDMPDGTPKKLMDSSRLRELGWTPDVTLEDGIESAYRWFLANVDIVRK